MSLANSYPSTSQRKYPRIVTFPFDTLRYELRLVLDNATKAQKWQVPLSFFIPLLFTCLVSNFEAKYGLQAAHWEMFTYVLTGLSAIWLAVGIWHSNKKRDFDTIVEDLYSKSISKDEHRVLFFMKAITNNATEKMLVYKDPIWDCYLLPHGRNFQRKTEEADLKQILSQCLQVNASHISLNPMVGLRTDSYKLNYHDNKQTYYVFDFYYALLSNESCERVQQNTFYVNGTRYYWKTVDELLNDKKTYSRNKDVLLHIKDHYPLFFDSSISNSINTPLK
ncbi:MAG: hypothetical protein KTR29_11565 [Rhodothermaceae bacterium]|nr:hypothetical protein [Rhodothermaceae bacterium]